MNLKEIKNTKPLRFTESNLNKGEMMERFKFTGYVQAGWKAEIRDDHSRWLKDKKEEGYHATQVFRMGVSPVTWLEYKKPVKITIEWD